MSLHDSASQVQSAGRGEDKVLVHMTPGEVNGLQSLAMAHGGSLTINPTTGLPEASFLRSLLPTLIGFGLAPLTGGLSAALITGAGYTAATGSLKKGIMAGLGAYGGAGLAGGLNAMGATAGAKAGAAGTAANTPVMNVANTGVEGMKANLYGPGKGVFSTTPSAASNVGLKAYTPSAPIHSGGVSSVPTALQGSGPGGFGAAQPGVFTPGSAGGTAIPTPAPGPVVTVRAPDSLYADTIGKYQTNLPQAVPYKGEYLTAGKVGDVVPKAYTNKPILNITEMQRNAAAVTPKTLATDATVNATGQTISRPYTDYMSQVGQGAEKVYAGGVDGLGALADAMPKYSIAAGLGGTAGTYAIERQEKAEEEMRNRKKESPGMIRPYEFNYGPTDTAFEPYSGSAERTYFQPSFTALTPYEAPGPEYKKAEGGLASFAVGGPVEQMSAMNAIGANAGYPMANINTPVYSNPMMQRPEATNVIAPSADAGVAAYTGEARFAKGGGTVDPQNQSSGYEYSYDPKTMRFTQTAGPSNAGAKSSPFGFGSLITQALGQGTSQPQNVTPDGTVSGGIATPVRQPTSPAQPFVPNIDIPAYQTPGLRAVLLALVL